MIKNNLLQRLISKFPNLQVYVCAKVVLDFEMAAIDSSVVILAELLALCT